MDQFNLGIIRVLTTENEQLLNAHGKIIGSIFPSLNIVSRCIAEQERGIYDEKTEQLAIPKIVELASQFEEEGFQAIIITCCADPGFKQVSETINIPIIGAGRSGAAAAVSLGSKIGVLGITEKQPVNLGLLLGDSLVSYLRPDQVKNTLDLLTEQGREKTLNAAEKLLAGGADTILLGCTGMATAGLAPIIEEKLGIKVIDPVVASGFFAWYALLRKRMQEGVLSSGRI